MAQDKISVYNLADLKNTSDDAIPNYLNSLGFVQSHRLTDVHLALGYSALALAAACFAWDYKLGFEATKVYSAAAVAAYVVLSTALTLWQRHVEGSTVYEGTVPASQGGRGKLTIRTTVEKYTPVYRLEATVVQAANNPIVVSVVRPFAEWFDSAGTFVAAPFQTMLATAIPVVGKADPKRVATSTSNSTTDAAATTTTTPPTEYSAEMLEALAAATATGASTGASSHKSGGGKRRKV